jgi:hypothetical protein
MTCVVKVINLENGRKYRKANGLILWQICLYGPRSCRKLLMRKFSRLIANYRSNAWEWCDPDTSQNPPHALREIAFVDNYAPNKYSLCILVLILRPHLCISALLFEAALSPCINIVPHLFVRGKVNFLAGSCVLRIVCCKECIVGRNFTRSFSHQPILHIRHNAYHRKALSLL